jgi:hypothetical protein
MVTNQSSSRLTATRVSPGSALAPRAPLTPPTPLAHNSFVSAKKIKVRKKIGHFAQCSPFNSFRISKQVPDTSIKAIELRRICAPQPLYNQQTVPLFRTVSQIPLLGLPRNLSTLHGSLSTFAVELHIGVGHRLQTEARLERRFRVR